MRLSLDIRMSPGIPLTAQLDRIFEMLVADDPLFAIKTCIGPPGKVTDPAALTRFIESGKQGVQLGRNGEGPNEPFLGLTLTKSPMYGSGVRGYLIDNEVASVVHKSHQLLDVVGAYLVRIEGREPPGGQINARVRQAMDAVKARFGGSPGKYWPHYLLCGLAHRTILSDELVEFLGADRIAALPPEFAWRENGRQIIAGTKDPIPLPTDGYDPQEKAIIEALDASDAFFNPETGELPTRIPDLPLAAPIRFWNDDGMYTVG